MIVLLTSKDGEPESKSVHVKSSSDSSSELSLSAVTADVGGGFPHAALSTLETTEPSWFGGLN